MSTVGIDTLLLKQPIKGVFGDTERKGLIGIGVEVDHIEPFKKSLEKSFGELLSRHKVESTRPIYSSRDIAKLLELDDFHAELDILKRLSEENIEHIARVHFFYTYLYGVKEVSIFGATAQYKKVPTIRPTRTSQDFYDIISSSYPIHCAWKFQQEDTPDSEVLVDNFQGRVSPSFALLRQGRVKVFYQGDRCNHLICMADILVRLLKIKMFPNKFCYREDVVKDTCQGLFGKKAAIHFLGKRFLNKISPNDTKRMRTQKLISHPTYFIAKENPKDEKEEDMIESSPKFNKAIREIASQGGCFKFYEKGNDGRLIRQGDKFIHYGDKGEIQYKQLLGLDYPLVEFK